MKYDFYQTDSHVIVAVYLKGQTPNVLFQSLSISIILSDGTVHKLEPLFALIRPEESSFRALSTKIELKLAKAAPANWSSVVASGSSKLAKAKPNWDKLEVEDDTSDPNAGGDAALQKMFAQIYAGADEDTKRAMIKSFTESGGTTLSTDWSSIGKERTPVRPPDGMEEKKF